MSRVAYVSTTFCPPYGLHAVLCRACYRRKWRRYKRPGEVAASVLKMPGKERRGHGSACTPRVRKDGVGGEKVALVVGR